MSSFNTSVIPVSINPGATAFTNIPLEATSFARLFVNPIIPAFEAEQFVCPALFDTDNFKTKLAGEVKEYDALEYFEQKQAKRFDKSSQFAVIAFEAEQFVCPAFPATPTTDDMFIILPERAFNI